MDPSAQTDTLASPILAGGMVQAVRAAARVLLARVHETVTGPAQDADDIAGMSDYMLRDIGAETSLRARIPARELEYPRL